MSDESKNAKDDGNTQPREFRAEVKKVLDIVIHSLYTNRDIFVRELVSNSADALEKARHEQLSNEDVFDKDLPLEIEISLDETNHRLTVADTGVGMTEEELVENLGTIAHSGSAEFLTQLAEAAKQDVNLIGQFGVGFYSAFMVGKSVRVETRSARPDARGMAWTSDGESYRLEPVDGLHRGTRVIVDLKDDAHDYEKEETIKRIIKEYSNFVPFPIKIKGEAVNTVQAIWTRPKNEIKDEEYDEFYKFVSGDMAEPAYRLHFSSDAPLQINALLFAPKMNIERLGFMRMEPGVDLYCRKVLIERRPEDLLPEWLRFARGVIDSEDLPLNISRETLQDSALIRKLGKVLIDRFLKMLEAEAGKDADKYADFWREFSPFLKEGALTDPTHRDRIAPLLRFETSKTEPGKLASLKEVVERMKDGQKALYYINGPSRESIEAGPYLEEFRRRDVEVIYTMEPQDDFVLTNLRAFDEKEFVSADSAELDLPEAEAETPEGEPLADEAMNELCGWMKTTLGDRVQEVRKSDRLVDSPVMAVNPRAGMTTAMRRVMQNLHHDFETATGQLTLELNPRHALVKRLAELRGADEELAKSIAEQLFDNAVIAAGLMVDPRLMIRRINRILERAAGTE